jgi:hypothetical protein
VWPVLFKCVLIVEDSYLVLQINAKNGCYAQRREAAKSGESQCGAKIFLTAARRPGGGTPKSKNPKNRKIENRKTAKIKNANFPIFPRAGEKPKIPGIARAFLTTDAEAQKGIALGRFSMPPLTALYWL